MQLPLKRFLDSSVFSLIRVGQKLAPSFPLIDNCLKVTKLLKVGCLPYAVGKQPSIPLINLGRT